MKHLQEYEAAGPSLYSTPLQPEADHLKGWEFLDECCTLGPEQPGDGWSEPQRKPGQVQTRDRRRAKAKTNMLVTGLGHLAASMGSWEFHPLVKNITVVDGPILSGIEFIQLKVQVLGKIANLPKSGNVFPNIPVTLKMIQYDQTEETVTLLKTHAKDGAYSFDNILPGKYEVTVEKIEWCWESTSYIIDVNSLESTVPIFVQTGFTVTFVSSHDTELDGMVLSATRETPRGGDHVSFLMASFIFGRPPCLMSGALSAKRGWAGLPPPPTTHPFGQVSPPPPTTHHFGQVSPSPHYTPLWPGLPPLHTTLGRSPPSPQHTPSWAGLSPPPNTHHLGQCLEKAVAFKADYGKIIEGKIFPPLAGVEITIENENTSERVSVTETNHNGTYRLMNECLAQGRIPNVWKRREVVIPSKGEDKDPQLPKSYRPICLMNVCAKTARENSMYEQARALETGFQYD
uniref:Uncharacterized protein n=1 Tax=Timema monikensis TaxID=170555 RepID=A0A7R9HRW8_9NEOP|nr:unnamed protein product [Timema monikensis]